jgi:membrane protease YdiL (CAAX protease family)
MATDSNNSTPQKKSSIQSRWNEQFIEVSVFLFLIVPSMVFSFFVVRQGSLSFVLVAFATILRDLALVSLILFFIWRNSETIDWIGWTFKNVWKEIALGVGLFIPLFITSGLLESALLSVGFSSPSTPLPSLLATGGMAESLLGLILVIIVAMAEETIFRGYLILRLKAITASPAAAVLLSAVIFSLGHGYEGSAGVVTVGFMGLVFALVYMWRKCLIASVVMHFLQDFIGIVLVPLVRMR